MDLHYEKPPITEAILDLRVEPPTGVSAAELLSGLSAWKKIYPRIKEISAAELVASGDVPLPLAMTGGIALGGFQFASENRHRVIQARRDGFVYSFAGTEEQLYPGWETFSREAMALWGQYLAAWQPQRVIRVATRYVNQFNLSTLTDKRLAMLPRFPRPQFLGHQELRDFSFNLVLPQKDIEATVVLNSSLLPGKSPRTLVLDIDVFRERLALDPQDRDTLQTILDNLRDRKNAFFQACITEEIERTLEPEERRS